MSFLLLLKPIYRPFLAEEKPKPVEKPTKKKKKVIIKAKALPGLEAMEFTIDEAVFNKLFKEDEKAKRRFEAEIEAEVQKREDEEIAILTLIL